MARARPTRGGIGRLGAGTSARERRIVQGRLQDEFSRKPHREALGITAGSAYSQTDMQALLDRVEDLLEDDMKAGLRARRR